MLKPVEKPIKFIKNLSTKGKSYPITHVSAVIDDENKSIGQLISNLKKGLTLIETNSNDLRNQRDNGELLVGSLYRLTDVDGNAFPPDSPYYGHLLDVVLIATSPNTFSEEGWAMMHDNIYDVTFADGVTKKCWIYDNGNNPMAKYNIVDAVTLKGLVISIHTIEIDEEHKTAVVDLYYSGDLEDEGLTYNYFQNSNLSAWKVWYCLDNDKSRFAWADDRKYIKINPNYWANIGYEKFYRDASYDTFVDPTATPKIPLYGWKNNNDEVYYTFNEQPQVGDLIVDEDGEQVGTDIVDEYASDGRGVIYAVEEGSWVNNSTGAVKIIEVGGNTPTQELAPNTFYKFTGNITSLTVTLGLAKEDELAIYAFCFIAGTNNPTVNFPESVDADEVSISIGDYVEYSIMNNKAAGKTW